MDADLLTKNKASQNNTQTPAANPAVRGLATDLAKLFMSGALSERDIRRLPKNIRLEVLEKKASMEGVLIPEAASQKEIPVNTEKEIKKEDRESYGAVLPPAISGVVEKPEKTESGLYKVAVPEKKEFEQGNASISFTENDITLARKEMERQRQALAYTKKEPLSEPRAETAKEVEKKEEEKEGSRVLEIKKGEPEKPLPEKPAVKEKQTDIPTEPEKTKTIETEESLDSKITNLLAAIEALPKIDDLFGAERKSLLLKKKALEEKEKPLKEKEQFLEQKVRQLDEETIDSPNEERLKERWEAETARQTVEQERWKVDEERVILLEEENRLIQKETTETSKERALREELELLRKKKTRLVLEREKVELEKRLNESKKQEEPLEIEWIRLNEKKKSLSKSLASSKNILEQIVLEKKELEEKEAAAKDSAARHNTEIARWEVEKRRKEAEIAYLENKKLTDDTERGIVSLTEEYRKILRNELEMKKETKRIEEELITLP